MQIIDKEGRLFGKVHLLDVGVVAVVAAAGYGLFLGYWVLSGHVRRAPVEGRLPTSLVVELLVQDLDPSTVPLIRVGDVQRDRDGAKAVTLIAVDDPVPDTMPVSFGRQALNLRRPGRSKLTVLAKIKGEVQGNVYFFNGQMIGVGENIALAMPRYAVMGVILRSFPVDAVEGGEESWRWKRVVIELKVPNVSPEIMKTITIGDVIEDEQGIPIAKVAGIKNAFLGEVKLLIEVRCLQAGKVCDSQQLGPIEFGRKLKLNFPGYWLDGEIADFR